MQEQTLSLIVPVHAGQDRQVFTLSLASILRLAPQPFEIIVVSDGPQVTLPAIEGISLIRQVSTPGKLGPAGARNHGARHASGDLLCFIDSDIVVPPDLITRIFNQFETHPSIAALFGSYDDQPYQPNFLSQYRNLLHHYVHQTSSEEAFTFWSGCGIIRRAIFLEMEGFDSVKYPLPSIEDIELGYRLKQHDCQIRLSKTLQVKHLKEWRPLSMVKVDFYNRALPWSKLIRSRDGYKTNDLNIKWTNRLSVIIVFLLLLSGLVSVWKVEAALVVMPLYMGLFLLNYQLYRFFLRKRGARFMLQVLPWHVVFYFICGLSMLITVLGWNQSNQDKRQVEKGYQRWSGRVGSRA